jgi:hypothetical protein
MQNIACHGRTPGLVRHLSLLLIFFCVCSFCHGQTLRYSNHREVAIPDYATLRIGPFYSMMTFSQSVGGRYSRAEGTGVDFLYENVRGVMKTNGYELPLVSRLDLRNYLMIGRHTDLDISMSAAYSYFPLKTQENEFIFALAEEGVLGNVSLEFNPTPFVKGTLYENAVYRTDYVDTRGLVDRYGGQAYVFFDNTVGVNMDWLMAQDKNMAFSASMNNVLPRDTEFEDQKHVTFVESLAYEQTVNPFILVGSAGGFGQTAYSSTNRASRTATQTYSVYSNIKLTKRTIANASVGYSLASASPSSSDAGEEPGIAVGQASIETQLSRQLKHSVGWARSRRGGFNSDFEVADGYQYKMEWKGELTSANIFSTLSTVTPDKTSVNKYSDWQSGMKVDYPLVPSIVLRFSSLYDIRENQALAVGESSETEWNYDYTTWDSQIGTSFAVDRETTFSVYAEHVERRSNSSDLMYQMDIIGADLTYTHAF